MWDKIKEYLTSWKQTNFGNGIYDVNGVVAVDILSRLMVGPPDGNVTISFVTYTRVSLMSRHGVRFVTTDWPAQASRAIALRNDWDDRIERIVIYYWHETEGFKLWAANGLMSGTSVVTPVISTNSTWLIMW